MTSNPIELSQENKEQDGLYHPSFEHDSCGIGFVANLDGRKTRNVVKGALTMLENMEHRGGQGAEPTSGDGAGILVQIPHEFLVEEAQDLGFTLPTAGTYGVGNTFFPKEKSLQRKCILELEKYVTNFQLELIGYRNIPVNNEPLGKSAKDSEPAHIQFFVAPKEAMDEDTLERKMVVLRKYANRTIHQLFPSTYDSFYISSLSCRTLIYKGQLTTEQLQQYFLDLQRDTFESALALVHSRFSTNTTPKWKLAQPFRYIAHNGEINTIAGNVNGMSSKTALFKDSLFSEQELELIHPICDVRRSDSSNLDNVVEILTASGRSLPHAMMMLVPEAYENDANMPQYKKDFYGYHAHLMEAWDGPASLSFTDGKVVGAVLDRNGLRPSRYTLTKDGMVIMSSEAGSLPVEPSNVLKKGRLEPGKMFVADLQQGRIITDEELKEDICKSKPYGQWLADGELRLEDLPAVNEKALGNSTYEERLRFHGYTKEEVERVLLPMFNDAKEAIGSMGADNPIAALSEQPQHLSHYFRQRFAQVSNPPIDSIRERSVMSLTALLGKTRNVLDATDEHCRKIRIEQPVLTNGELQKLRNISAPGFASHEIESLFYADNPQTGLENAIKSICKEADFAVKSGNNLLIISDRNADKNRVAIPSLLAVGAIHHYLIKQGVRSNVSLVVECGDARSTHHFATLLGYGANAVNPYMVYDILRHSLKEGRVESTSDNTDLNAYFEKVKNYQKAIGKGLLKIFAKMGISTLESYQGAQIFEPIGLNGRVVGTCFRGSLSRIGGLDFEHIAKEQLDKLSLALNDAEETLPYGGVYHWRVNGEYHHMNPRTITALQRACREGNYEHFKNYSALLDGNGRSLRHLLEFKQRPSVPLEEVEAVENILKRFATGAMSFGSISHEAHSTLAVAMNRIGAKSNSGEGGEDEIRFGTKENGDSENSAIKQIASGRFGVTINYLANAVELQIKMAQGAKPGEGGHLPGHKVDDWIGRVRHSTPGVGLISPPPHHDIYSIEDLAQLIYDLKRANPKARVSVKLVSLAGVGTIATGVVKAKADTVLISGMDGGTGASPLSSIQHAGVPWELGLAEAHQTLVSSRLRDRVLLQTDGMIRTGRDLAIATLLGAEEWGVATAALIAEGCIMMRKCHLNTCPVGIATQNPELRKLFSGKPEHVINMFSFMAQELREIMAELGFRTIEEMVGQAHVLKQNTKAGNWKAALLNLDPLLKYADWSKTIKGYPTQPIPSTALDTAMVEAVHKYKADPNPAQYSFQILNTDRSTGTTASHEVAKWRGSAGLPGDALTFNLVGSAGQSFGAFGARGLTFDLVGESNDYTGKGLSGAKIIIRKPEDATIVAHDNIICGNVALYGATSGELYVNGIAGERFCVRNSGAKAIVEGVGDHGLEYMTGGEAIILGATGKNFGAGMSGGIVYVLDADGTLESRFNNDSADLEQPTAEDLVYLKSRIQVHLDLTGSERAKALLGDWNTASGQFVKVFPRDYKRVLEKKKHKHMGKDTGFLEVNRQGPAMRQPEERVKDYKEHYLPLGERATEQASRCMDCGVPFCNSGCPLGNRIPEFNDAVYRGDYKEAYSVLRTTNNFPEFTGRICPAPCEAACVLGINNNPVTIEFIEKEISEKAWEEGWVVPKLPVVRTGKSVAVVGAGPAGLAAADQLNQKGHRVKVFERDARVGGLLTYGIPDYKLEKHVVARRAAIMEAEGVVFQCGTEIGTDITLEELRESFDAVLITIGSKQPRDIRAKGREAKGVHFAMDFLHLNNQKVAGDAPVGQDITAKDKTVLVIGGGDTGSDCIGTSIRQGAKEVIQVTIEEQPPLERAESNPWPEWPKIMRTSSSHEEGCERLWGLNATSFNADQQGNLVSVSFDEVRGEELAGRWQFVPTGAQCTIECDMAVLAIGFVHPEHEGLVSGAGLSTDPRGNIATEGYKTSMEGVFTAGDARRGQSLVVWAIAEGRQAADAIDESLVVL